MLLRGLWFYGCINCVDVMGGVYEFDLFGFCVKGV